MNTLNTQKKSFTESELKSFIPAFEAIGWDGLQEEFQRNYSPETIEELRAYFESIYE